MMKAGLGCRLFVLTVGGMKRWGFRSCETINR